MASAGVYSTLLTNAFMTAPEYNTQILMGADARATMKGLVQNYPAAQGDAFYIPKLSPFSAADTVTRGASGTEGTDLSSTFETISDTGINMTKTFAYSGIQVPWTAKANLTPQRAAATLGALRMRMEQAVAKRIDVTLLGLYSGLTQQVGSNASGIDWATFASAVELLEEANAPRPYYAVLHPKQYATVFGIDEFVKASTVADLGDGAPLRTGTNLNPLGVRIFFSSNVVDSSGLHNLVFSPAAFGFQPSDSLRVEEEVSAQKLSDFMVAYMDFAVAEQFDTYAVDLLTASS